MTRNADPMYDTRPPPPHISRLILGDGLIKKIQFIGKLIKCFTAEPTTQLLDMTYRLCLT